MATLKGKVLPGKGVGSKIMEDYIEIFKEALGYDFIPGTLNLELEKDPKFNWGGRIEPFRKKDGTQRYGVYYLEARIRDILVFIIRPEKTTHPKNVIELISSINLRKHFKLKDGDFLELVF